MRFPELPGYRYEGFLGEDSFGWSFVATHDDGKRRAVRVYKAQATSDRLLQSYFKVFSDPATLTPGVSRVHDHTVSRLFAPTVCATPFYGWKGKDGAGWQVASLKRLAAHLTREQVLEVIRDLAACLADLHGANLFHGGIRPSGVFLAGDAKGGQKVRLGEFGQLFMGGLQYLEAGDLLFYVSPEQLATGDFTKGRGQQWDVYAFGVVAYELLVGSLPRLQALRLRGEQHPGWLEQSPAITFGELTEVSEQFLAHLESESKLAWAVEAKDSREVRLRAVIDRCLAFEAGSRPSSMVEVAESLHKVFDRSSATTVASSAPESLSSGASRALFEESVPEPVETRARALPLEKVGRSLKGNPVLRWQLTALASMVAILPLTYFSLFSFWKSRETIVEVKEEIDFQIKEQTSVKNQALAYQRELLQTKENNEMLISELNDAENSKNNLVGQAKLARQLLRQTQDNGDRFFRLVLENRDSDVPGFREGRRAALVEGRRHYERLVEAYGDAPDFIVSTANALFYLGQIYREMGEFGKALASYGEAERRYTALLEDPISAKVEFLKNIAISKDALGELSLRSGEFSAARHYFTESSRFWSEARSQDPEIATAAALYIHENSLDIVECEFAMDRLDAAIDAAMSVGVRLTEMQEARPDDPRVIGALARSFSLAGRVLEVRRENELAKEAYQQSSDLFARAVSLNAAVDAYHLGLGNSLARAGMLARDHDKLENAAEILARVVASNPYESAYLRTLADIYGVLAANQRDGGRLKNAVALEEKSIAILKPIVEGNANVALDVRYSYAQRLAHLAELLGDSGRFDESREPLREAVALLEDIATTEGASAQYRRSLARTLGLAGFACIKAGDKSQAKEHLELARSEWQSYMESNPDDDDAAQAVKWTAEQLKRLQ